MYMSVCCMYVQLEHYKTEDQESPNFLYHIKELRKTTSIHRIAISISLLQHMNSDFLVYNPLQIY